MVCLKARRQSDRPIAPAEAKFLLIPKGPAQEKYRNKESQDPAPTPDPREGVQTRHKDPGSKGEHQCEHI